MVDFNGWAAVSNRKIEDETILSASAQQYLNRHFVVARLYVDDRSEPPSIYKDSLNLDNTTIETYGDLWMTLQVKHFQQVTQPFYVQLDCQGRLLTTPANYQTHGNQLKFLDWLKGGLSAYEQVAGECMKSSIKLK